MSEEEETITYGLDYNDQCDLVFGRMRRLLADSTELDPLGMTLDGMLVEGLDVKGLGLSGAQVSAVFGAIKAEALAVCELRELVVDAWGVIANASDWDDNEDRSEWQAAAERWRDRYCGNAMPNRAVTGA